MLSWHEWTVFQRMSFLCNRMLDFPSLQVPLINVHHYHHHLISCIAFKALTQLLVLNYSSKETGAEIAICAFIVCLLSQYLVSTQNLTASTDVLMLQSISAQVLPLGPKSLPSSKISNVAAGILEIRLT